MPLLIWVEVELRSVVHSCLTLCNPMDCSTPGFVSFTISQNLLKLMSIESMMPSNYLVLCYPFSSCLQSFLASGSFPMSQFFTSSGQSIGVSASASVLPMNIQDWFPLGLHGWISLQFKGLSRVFSSTTSQKHEFLSTQPFLWLNSPIHDYWKNHSFEYTDLVSKVMSLLFNMLSRFVITGEGNGKPL